MREMREKRGLYENYEIFSSHSHKAIFELRLAIFLILMCVCDGISRLL